MAGEPRLLPLQYGDQPHHYPQPHPSLGPGSFQQWVVRQYRRQASCAEVDCANYLNGWRTVLDETTPQGRQLADWIRYHSGLRFILGKSPAGWTQFTFPPGQTCFEQPRHFTVAERPPVGLIVPGDHRARTGQARVYDRVDQFVDDFRTHTEQIATARSRAGTAE